MPGRRRLYIVYETYCDSSRLFPKEHGVIERQPLSVALIAVRQRLMEIGYADAMNRSHLRMNVPVHRCWMPALSDCV